MVRTNANVILLLSILISVAGELQMNNIKRAEKSTKIDRIIENFPENYGTKKSKITAFAVTDIGKPLKIVKIFQETFSKLMERFPAVGTLVFYGFSETIFQPCRTFIENRAPLVVINGKINWKVKDVSKGDILNIMFSAAEYPSGDDMLNTLKQTLKGQHLSKIIIIKEIPIKAKDPVVIELLNWLHVNGFWQSLLMDFKGNSITLQHFTGTLKWNLTLAEFLQPFGKWHNLMGFPIICAMASNPPRAYLRYDSHEKVSLSGFYGTAITLFSKHYNASLKPFILSTLDYYNEMDCLKYINDNMVDICGDALPLADQYTVSEPEEIVASHLIVPYDKPLPRFYYFLKPFQFDTWTLVTFSFFYKIVTLSLIHRLQNGSWNCGSQMLTATLSVLYQPFQLTSIKGSYRRFLEIILILVGFVVANWYLSVLSSLLFSRLYFHDIQSLQNLVDHNISIMIDEFELFLLNRTVNDPLIMQQLKVVSNEVLLQHRRNLDPRYAYYSIYDKVTFYLHQQKFLIRPRMKVLTGIAAINEMLCGMPMHPNWPFQHLWNDFYRRVIESGVYSRIYAEALEEGITSGYLHYFPSEHHSVEPLSIEYFQLPATLLAVGYILAFAAFLLELLVFKGK